MEQNVQPNGQTPAQPKPTPIVSPQIQALRLAKEKVATLPSEEKQAIADAFKKDALKKLIANCVSFLLTIVLIALVFSGGSLGLGMGVIMFLPILLFLFALIVGGIGVVLSIIKMTYSVDQAVEARIAKSMYNTKIGYQPYQTHNIRGKVAFFQRFAFVQVRDGAKPVLLYDEQDKHFAIKTGYQYSSVHAFADILGYEVEENGEKIQPNYDEEIKIQPEALCNSLSLTVSVKGENDETETLVFAYIGGAVPMHETVGYKNMKTDLLSLCKKLDGFIALGKEAPAEEAPAEETVAEEVAPAEAPTEVAEKTTYSVVLKEIGKNKIDVIKVVMQATGLDLADAKKVVEFTGVIKENVPQAEAESLVAEFEKAGATAEIQ